MGSSFVGRHDELTAIAAAMAAVEAGRPTVIMVDGPGGSGKTSLVEAFLAETKPWAVVQTTGDEAETTLPFGVLDQISDGFARLLGNVRGERQAERGCVAASGGLGHERDPFLEGGALLRRLQSVARRTPVVLVVDDAHLADGPSLTALTFALRRLRAECVFTILTARSELSWLTPGLERLINTRGERIALEGLSVDEVAALAVATGFGRITRRGAARLRDRTRGNPLHLRALMADLSVRAVESVDEPLPVPRSLALLTVAALGATSRQSQHLAAAAAVLGVRSSLRDAAKLSGAFAQSLSPEGGELAAAVQELQKAHLARLVDTLHGSNLVFVHDLVRAAVYDDLGAATRLKLHLGAALLSSGTDALRHRVAASMGNDAGLIAELIAQAKAHRALGAWSAAAGALLDAVRLSDPGPAKDELLIDAVALLLVGGDLHAALGYADDLADVPVSSNRLQVQARMAWLLGDRDQAETLARRAWASAAELAPNARDAMASMLSHLCIMRGDGSGAVQWSERALASGLLPATEAAATVGAQAVGLALTGRMDAGLALLSRSLQGSANPSAGFRPELVARGMLRLWSDDLLGSRADLRACVPTEHLSLRQSLEPYRLVALGYLAEAEFRCGDWDQAARLAEQAVLLVEDSGQVWLRAFTQSVAVLVPAGRGQWVLAERHLAEARQAADQLGDEPAHAYADNAAVHLAMCRHDPERAIWHAQRLMGGISRERPKPGFLGWPVHYAAALVEAQRLGEAAEFVGALTARASYQNTQYRGSALERVRGEVAAQRRDTTAARAAFENAIRLSESSVDVLEKAVLFASYGRFLRRRGERRSAVTRLGAARSLFLTLGAEPFLTRCEDELQACGLSSASPSAGIGPGLTPQETTVVRLVCAGLSNRQIANQLGVSVKTVVFHLGHVYAKTGVTSRTALVAQLGSAMTSGT